MIRVTPAPTPTSLVGDDSIGGRERKRVIDFYANAANADEPFTFRAYKSVDVVQQLNDSFGGKCAYCEGSWEGTAPVDVEHWRPKGGYAADGRLKKPGYYWLAAEWMNLLPSCIDCNRERTQEFQDAPPHLAGKANKFPLPSEKRRATAVGREHLERPRLLHPYLDDPAEHLEFLDEGAIAARRTGSSRSRKGVASIETYGLQRIGLVNRRFARQREIEMWMEVVRRSARRFQQSPSSETQQDLQDDLGRLETYRDPGGEYSAMAVQMIDAFRQAEGL
jgi:uncharacterized protein (TIGR02646 family)